MSSLEKVLALAGSPLAGPEPGSLESELLLAARVAMRELSVLLAGDGLDDEGDDGDGGEGDGHSDHGTYKALIKKGVKPAMAAKMCARADSRVRATALAEAAQVVLAALDCPGALVGLAAPPGESAADRRSLARKGHALPDGSYPIPDKAHLRKAAILAASGHGDVKAARALIRRRARELGVDVSSLPGFGRPDDEEKGEKVAATMLTLAAAPVKGVAAQGHPPFHGVHSHMHVHSGDNMHGRWTDRVPVHGY